MTDMPEYIDRKALQEMLNAKAEMALGTSKQVFYAVAKMVELLPAADVAPVVHFRWIETKDQNKKRCGRCDVIHLIAQYPNGNANFCPNCGAKMDGGSKRGS